MDPKSEDIKGHKNVIFECNAKCKHITYLYIHIYIMYYTCMYLQKDSVCKISAEGGLLLKDLEIMEMLIFDYCGQFAFRIL